jgi:hypothetical protein
MKLEIIRILVENPAHLQEILYTGRMKKLANDPFTDFIFLHNAFDVPPLIVVHSIDNLRKYMWRFNHEKRDFGVTKNVMLLSQRRRD